MGKKSSYTSNDGVDDSETKLKSKNKKIQKELKNLTKSIRKCSGGLEKSQQILETDADLPEKKLKEKETPKKKFECGFAVQEAEGSRWGNDYESIFVKGFDSSLPRDGIKRALRKHFCPCGEVIRVFVPVECETGAPLGFAFINLKDENDIKNALTLNGSDLGGKKLEVVMATDRDEFYYYPYPNFKGCEICSVRDQRMRIYYNYYATLGGRIMTKSFLESKPNPFGRRVPITKDEQGRIATNRS